MEQFSSYILETKERDIISSMFSIPVLRKLKFSKIFQTLILRSLKRNLWQVLNSTFNFVQLIAWMCV